jgi:ElaB/YqjD/DUF883 family membrane-anchored ribosome-binding protein
MAKRLHRSSDVPDFDTYPANPKDKDFLRTDSSNELEERARQVGSAMGKAVVAMRKTQERLKDMANQTGEAAASRITHVKNMAEETASRVSDISETMKAKAQEWTEAASARAEEWRQATVERVSEVGSQIKSGYYRTRLRANQVVQEYPVQVVLIAGAIGFLLGVSLRIWRMNREY